MSTRSENEAMHPSLSAAKKPYFSTPQLMWYGIFSGMAAMNILSWNMGLVVTAILAAIGLLGLPVSHEGPLFVRFYIGSKNLWRRYKKGDIYTRSLSQTSHMFNKKGVRISAPFDVTLRAIPMRDPSSGQIAQFPVFDLPGERHCSMVTTESWGDMVMADPPDANVYILQALSAILRVLQGLSPGDHLTMIHIRRPADLSEIRGYMADRLHQSVIHATKSDGVIFEQQQNLYDGAGLIYSSGTKNTSGIVVNVSRPTSWKPRSLDKLTADQLRSSALIKSLNSLLNGLRSAGQEGLRVQSLFEISRTVKEALSQGEELVRYRALIANDTERSIAGELKSLFDADSLRIGPWPLSNVQLMRDHIIFDRTYLRVMWVTNFQAEMIGKGAFDNLYRLPVPSTVSLNITTLSRSKSRKSHQRRTDFMQTMHGMLRSPDLVQDPEQREQIERSIREWNEFADNGKLDLEMRLLIVIAADSIEELDKNESIVNDELQTLQMISQVVVGENDQLEWLFAALGMNGK